MNLRPSGYERDFTQPADGRRPSCFRFSRMVSRGAKSTEVHPGIRESPPVWTRSGQNFGEPASNRRPSPWQGEQIESPSDLAPHQPSPSERIYSGNPTLLERPHHQRSPSIHSRFVPQVFARWCPPSRRCSNRRAPGMDKRRCPRRGRARSPPVRQDHLNVYRIPCSAVVAATKGKPAP